MRRRSMKRLLELIEDGLLNDIAMVMFVLALALLVATMGIVCWKAATAPAVPSTHLCQPVEAENPGGLWRCWNPDLADYGG